MIVAAILVRGRYHTLPLYVSVGSHGIDKSSAHDAPQKPVLVAVEDQQRIKHPPTHRSYMYCIGHAASYEFHCQPIG